MFKWIFINLLVLLLFLHVSFSESPKPPKQHDILDSPEMLNKEHLAEHYDGVADVNKEKLNEEETMWHFFVQHDLNNDTKLDGTEILKGIMHSHHDLFPLPKLEGKSQAEGEQILSEYRAKKMKYWEEQTDDALKDRDLNNDGYITWTEMMHVQHEPA